MQCHEAQYINSSRHGSGRSGIVRIMIVDDTHRDLEHYSRVFREIFKNSVVMKYSFINEAVDHITQFFHIDFFLLNAYCNNVSCSSLIRNIRNIRNYDMSMIFVTIDPCIAAAVSKQTVMHQWKSYNLLEIIEKPISLTSISTSIARLVPRQHKQFKKIDIVNKEMRRVYKNGMKTSKQEGGNKPTPESIHTPVKLPAINHNYRYRLRSH